MELRPRIQKVHFAQPENPVSIYLFIFNFFLNIEGTPPL